MLVFLFNIEVNMKRSEKEHLKEDPFKIFITNAVETIKESKKIFITGLLILIVLIIIVLTFLHFKSEAEKKDNRTFIEIVRIMKSNKTVDEKISELKKLETNSGINAVSKIDLASLYFMKQDYKNALNTLNSMSTSIDVLKEKQMLLKSGVLIALKKNKEALNILINLSNISELEIPRDSVLYSLAKVQISLNKNKDAAKTLKKLIKKYPNSLYVNQYAGGKANEMLKNLEKPSVKTAITKK
jgi:predicted negative regulator of RcsB-dependent stress response